MNSIISNTTAKITAKVLAEYLRDKINSSEIFHLAVSGGSTPKMLFEAMVAIKSEIQWKNLQLYWVDERSVLPTDEESNYRMTDESLLSKVALPKANIHRMKGELAPEISLEDYQKDLDLLPHSYHIPQFDLVILGMGDDGHTASIFPPEKELISIENDLAIGTNPYSGQKRLTLTGRTIKNAKEIIFHITGKNKAGVLDEILNKKGNYEQYPAYYFMGDKTVLYVDKEALSS